MSGRIGAVALLQIVHKSAQAAYLSLHGDDSRSIGFVLVLPDRTIGIRCWFVAIGMVVKVWTDQGIALLIIIFMLQAKSSGFPLMSCPGMSQLIFASTDGFMMGNQGMGVTTMF